MKPNSAAADKPVGKRIYSPRMFCKKEHQKWVNREVTVEKWYAYFKSLGNVNGLPIHEARYFGYVVELDQQIPEDELLRGIRHV